MDSFKLKVIFFITEEETYVRHYKNNFEVNRETLWTLGIEGTYVYCVDTTKPLIKEVWWAYFNGGFNLIFERNVPNEIKVWVPLIN